MADAIYICILRFWKSDNWYLPETWQVICQNTRQEQVQQVEKRDPSEDFGNRFERLADAGPVTASARRSNLFPKSSDGCRSPFPK